MNKQGSDGIKPSQQEYRSASADSGAPESGKSSARHKIPALAGNILLGIALAIAVYLIADTWLFNRAPAGTCPLTANRPWIWLAVGLSVLSLILSFFEPKKEP